MTKALTFIDRLHRRMFGHKSKLDLRFEQEMRLGLNIIARSEGKVVTHDTDIIEPAVTITPRRVIVRERLPIKRVRERLDVVPEPVPVTPPKPPVTLSMLERLALQPPRPPVERPEHLVDVSRSVVSHVAAMTEFATMSHEASKHRVLTKAIKQELR